jgi:hypothetical protein
LVHTNNLTILRNSAFLVASSLQESYEKSSNI